MIERLRTIGIGGILRFGWLLARVAIRHPREALDHLETQFALNETTTAVTPVQARDDWREQLHRLLDTPYPCVAGDDFTRVWDRISAEVTDVPAGQAHDADPALAEVVWHAVRHLRPAVVVETGVSRGITSRVILEALRANAGGRLWSVDLPPLEDPWRRLVGTAVPAELRGRWSYRRGASSRLLPGVVGEVGEIDLFIHDSLHTPGNFEFELRTVWPRLRPGGLVVIDDADDCDAVAVCERVAGIVPEGFVEGRKGSAGAFLRKPAA
jgi:hypothetical protein